MQKSGIISILQTLEPAEIRQFGEFIRSPFHNKNQSVIKLFNYLRGQYPGFEGKALIKKDVYGKVFGKAQYNDGFMRKLIFELTVLSEEFLALIHYNNFPFKKELGLLLELENRKLDKMLSKALKEAELRIEKSGYLDGDYYYNKYQLAALKNNFTFRRKSYTKNLKDYNEKTLSDTTDNLTQFYLINAMTGYRHLLFKKKHEKVSVEYEFIDEIYNLIRDKDNFYPDNFTLKLHINEVKLLKENDPKYYFILKNILMGGGNSMSQRRKYSLYNILTVFTAVRKLNGDRNFSNEAFELIKFAAAEGLYKLPGKNYMDEGFFINAVFESLRVNKYAWAEDFIEEHSLSLVPENKDFLICYCRARVSFMRNEKEKALQQLGTIKSIKHSLFRSLVNNLLLQVYYEMLMYEKAYSLIDSYRHFLKKTRSEFSEIRIGAELNFLKIITVLFKAKEKSDISKLDNIRTELENGLNVRERIWLLKKITELKQA